jgi:hypothetical protein
MARKSTDTQELFAAFQAFMDAQKVGASETVPVRKAKSAPRTTRSSGTPAAELNATRKPKGTTPTRKTAKNVITCGEAWNLLGADPTYKPSDPNAPARNGQLWALNAAGKLRVV